LHERVIFLRDGNIYRFAARHGMTPELEEYARQHPISPGQNAVTGPAIYVRVSTDKQTIENQVTALRQIAERRGWEVVEQYHDAGISGDTTTPAGRLMFQVTGAFAEFVRQRVHAGLKRAVARGKQLGRPRINPAIEKRIQAQLRAGKGILRVARECGVGSGTVQRVKQEMEGPFDGAAA
jgi:DNA invertase Pin-like site-specific DNA recombinase